MKDLKEEMSFEKHLEGWVGSQKTERGQDFWLSTETGQDGYGSKYQVLKMYGPKTQEDKVRERILCDMIKLDMNGGIQFKLESHITNVFEARYRSIAMQAIKSH